ncbi:MAG: sialidase family protein [Clostridiales bacterium]|nr:sialidase family protein [Clostridiales bacterium]
MAYHQENMSIPFTCTWLHVFETNVEVTAHVKVNAISSESKVGLLVRLTAEDAWIKAGYDFACGKWYIADRRGKDFPEQVFYSEAASYYHTGEKAVLRIRAVGNHVTLFCNNSEVVTTEQAGQVTTGRVGLFTQYADASFEHISISLLSGQGRIEKAVLEQYLLPRDEYTEGASLFWYNDKLALINVYGELFLSFDQGRTFRKAVEAETEKYRFFVQSQRTQYIRLHSGHILKIDNYNGGKAYLSKDNGITSEMVGQLWRQEGLPKTWKFHGGMNDMLKEVHLSDGRYRVFYCADVRAYGNPEGKGKINYHWDEIYYTDDEGHTWRKSQMDTRAVSAMNHICESRIVGCSDGSLRMYCTWNESNCMRFFVSRDNGETWEREQAMPQMRCARSSHDLHEDPYEPGTIYMVFVYCKQDKVKNPLPRARLSLIRTRNGADWEYLMDVWRWDDTDDGRKPNINQIVDPSITVTKDYLFVLSGRSDYAGDYFHNQQRQQIVKIRKSDLIPYEKWPDEYPVDSKEITCIDVHGPDKTVYRQNENLDLAGGFIIVHYYDGTAEKVSLDAEGVALREVDLSVNYTSHFEQPDMSSCGKKWIRVDFHGFADHFEIKVLP